MGDNKDNKEEVGEVYKEMLDNTHSLYTSQLNTFHRILWVVGIFLSLFLSGLGWFGYSNIQSYVDRVIVSIANDKIDKIN